MNATNEPGAAPRGRKRKPPARVRDVIADRVRTLRHARGWSQQGLAAEMSTTGYPVGRVTVANIENAGRAKTITVDDLHALALALEVAPADLVCPVDDDAGVEVTPGRVFVAAQWRAYLTEGPEGVVPAHDDAAARLEGIAAALRGPASDRRADLARDVIRIGLQVLDGLAVRADLDNRKDGNRS